MNTVYNFGAIFDAVREVVLFFSEDPRGLVDNVHDTGYNLGLALFFIITPDLAVYNSNAVHWEKTNYDHLTEEDEEKMN